MELDKTKRDAIAQARVQAIRGVGSKGGYAYYAWGLYAPMQRQDGTWTYRLVDSGPQFTSDRRGRWKFEGVPVRPHVRHGSPAPNPFE